MAVSHSLALQGSMASGFCDNLGNAPSKGARGDSINGRAPNEPRPTDACTVRARV